MAERTATQPTLYRVTVVAYRTAESADDAIDSVTADLRGLDFAVQDESAVVADSDGAGLPALCGMVHTEEIVYDGAFRPVVVAS